MKILAPLLALTSAALVSDRSLWCQDAAPADLLAGNPSSSRVPPKTRPPNVLLVVADDFGIDMFPSYDRGGSDFPYTPVLDDLIRSGVQFDTVWAYPVCSPTRASLHTGRYPFRTGIGNVIANHPNAYGLPAAEITLPDMLDLGSSVYRHAAFGKWHLSLGRGDPNLLGG